MIEEHHVEITIGLQVLLRGLNSPQPDLSFDSRMPMKRLGNVFEFFVDFKGCDFGFVLCEYRK